MLVYFYLVTVFLVFDVKSQDSVTVNCWREIDQLYDTFNTTNGLKENNRCGSMDYMILLLRNQTLPKNFVADLPILVHLTIENALDLEPGAFHNVAKLTKIRFMWCKIKEIKEGVFNHLLVVDIDLSLNKIEAVAPGAFNDMPKLKKINLSHNKLTYWNSDWFFNTPSLVEVNFHLNKIAQLQSESLKNIQNVTTIDLSFNGISSIGDKLFGDTSNVEYLDLSWNYLEIFGDGVLNGAKNLKELDLSYNYLTCLSGNLDKIFVAETTLLYYNAFLSLQCDSKGKIDEWKKQHPLRQVEVDNNCKTDGYLY